MMRLGHYATAAPVGLSVTWVMIVTAVAPAWVAVACGGLVVWTSTHNDLDHPRFKGRLHPGAAAVRASAWAGYQLRTPRDVERGDFHRGPSHCVEWCALYGLVVALLTLQIPPLAPHAWWFGAAFAIGTATHIFADLPTPSGVPVSAIYNFLVHREVWRRHSLRWFSTDSAGERFLAIPTLFLVSTLMALQMLGLLGPLLTILTGVGGGGGEAAGP